MKYLLLFAIGIVGFSSSYGQDQIRLRFGATKSFGSGNNSGLNNSWGRPSLTPSGIGLEYFRPLPEKKVGYFVGAFFEVQGYSVGLNPAKFQSRISKFGYGSDYGSIKIYAGLEKTLIKNTRRNANTLSVIAGAALSINALGVRGTIGGPVSTGLTLNGDTYNGVYLNEPESLWKDGYYFIADAKTANTFTPDVFAGLRWNVRNRQGNTVFIAEGIVNYGLMPKVYIEFPYTLNGQPMTDRISNHGFNAQLNVLVPIKTFKNH